MNDSVIDSGVCWSAGMQLAGLADKKGAYQIINPEGSGVVVYMDRIEANSIDGSAYWTLRSYLSPITSANETVCNAKFGAGALNPSKVFVKSARIDSSPGSLHAEFYRVTGRPLIFCGLHWPVIELTPGKGLVV